MVVGVLQQFNLLTPAMLHPCYHYYTHTTIDIQDNVKLQLIPLSVYTTHPLCLQKQMCLATKFNYFV